MTAEHKIFNPLSLTRQNVIEPPVKARVVILLSTYLTTFSRVQGFPRSSDGKESACSAGDLASVPGWGRSPGEGNGNPLQYPCLKSPMDKGAWWAAVHGVAESQARLSD